MCLIITCMLILVVFFVLGVMTNHDGMFLVGIICILVFLMIYLFLVGIICILVFLMIYFFLGKIFGNKNK